MRGPLARRIWLALALYLAMIGAAVGIAWLRGEPLLGPLEASERDALALSLAAGILLAALTIGSTNLLLAKTRWARALRVEFRAAFEGARSRDLVVLALASGTAEELLFRGALQPWWGLAVTSLVFGAFHFVPSKALAPWALWAALMGLSFGLIAQETGSIVGAIVAHVAINAVNLHRIARFDPALDEAARLPSLLPRRRTRRR